MGVRGRILWDVKAQSLGLAGTGRAGGERCWQIPAGCQSPTSTELPLSCKVSKSIPGKQFSWSCVCILLPSARSGYGLWILAFLAGLGMLSRE